MPGLSRPSPRSILGDMIPRTVFLATLFLAGFPSAAEMYKWTDGDGVVHYGNSPPQEIPPSTEVERVQSGRVSSFEGSGAVSPAGGDLTLLKGASVSSPLEMFVTSWCPACRKASAALTAEGISFREYDIEKDPAALARAKALGYAGRIPFFAVNGRSRTGYSREWIAAALADR